MTKRFFTIEEVLAEYQTDPEAVAALDKAQRELRKIKVTLGPKAFADWLLGHFVGIEVGDMVSPNPLD